MREVAKLPTNKAPGIDNINQKMIKAAATHISDILTYIFNVFVTEPYVPYKLKIAKVIPIQKMKERFIPGNYRPINLLNIFNRILEKLMYARLYYFLTCNDIICNNQFGFRRNHLMYVNDTENSVNNARIRLLSDDSNTLISGKLNKYIFHHYNTKTLPLHLQILLPYKLYQFKCTFCYRFMFCLCKYNILYRK